MKRLALLVFLAALLQSAVRAGDDAGVVVREWLVSGTDPFPEGTDPFAAPPRKGVVDESPAAGGTWKRLACDPQGQANLLNAGFEKVEVVSAYLCAYVHSDEEQTATIRVGSDDGIRVYLNGVCVHTNWALRGWTPAQDSFPVRLGKGWNRLLLQVANNQGGFGGSALIDGAKGIRTQADRPADYAPVTTSPYLVLASLQLEPALAPKGKLALDADVKNLGTEPARGAEISVSGTDTAQAFETAARNPTRVRLLLDADAVLKAVAKGESPSVALSWTGSEGSGAAGLPLDAKSLLAILMGTPPLKPAYSAPRYDFKALSGDWSWGERFRPDLFQGGDARFAALLTDYAADDAAGFDQEWKAIQRAIDAGAKEVKKENIAFIGNSHIDMAWMWRRKETQHVVDITYTQALKFADEFPFFKYAQSSMQTFVWCDQLFPELSKKMRAAAKKGQFVPVGGMWVEPDCDLPSGESFVRQLLYGKGYIRDQYGIDIQVGWNPDSFGYAWTLPMIFRGAGIRYFVTQKLGWNDTTVFPYRLFQWESPDGSKVLTYFPFDYVDDAQPKTLAAHMRTQLKQQPGVDDMLDLYGVGDHGGGPTRAMIQRYIAMTKMKVFPTVEHESPRTFFERAAGKYPDAPVWDDELYLEYHRGTYTTHGDMKRNNRRMEARLEISEKLAALAAALDPSYAYPTADLDGAWKRTLFNQFHDLLPGSGIHGIYLDAHADYAEAKKMVGDVYSGAAEALCAEMKTDQRKGACVIVFNAHSWPVTGVVTVPSVRADVSVVDAGGKVALSSWKDGQLSFLARGVPGIGYAAYWIEEAQEGGAEKPSDIAVVRREDGVFVLSNGIVTAQVDRHTGRLVSLRGPGGREMLGGDGSNVLEMHADVPSQWDAWNIGRGGKVTLLGATAVTQGTEGPLSASVVAKYSFGGSTFVQRYVVTAHLPYLEIATDADWHESHKMLKAAFSCAADAKAATFEIPYGFIDRTTHPKTPAEKAKWEVSGHRWVDETDASGDFGVTLLNDCKYGFDISGHRLAISLLRSPKYPDPEADMGKARFSYALYPHAGGWRKAKSYRQGAEFNLPLRAVVLPAGHAGTLPPSGSLLSVDCGHVVVTAFKRTRLASDPPRYVVRLIEKEGVGGPVTVTFPFAVARAWQANLMEDCGKKLEPAGRSVAFKIGPLQLRTLVVEPGH